MALTPASTDPRYEKEKARKAKDPGDWGASATKPKTQKSQSKKGE